MGTVVRPHRCTNPSISRGRPGRRARPSSSVAALRAGPLHSQRRFGGVCAEVSSRTVRLVLGFLATPAFRRCVRRRGVSERRLWSRSTGSSHTLSVSTGRKGSSTPTRRYRVTRMYHQNTVECGRAPMPSRSSSTMALPYAAPPPTSSAWAPSPRMAASACIRTMPVAVDLVKDSETKNTTMQQVVSRPQQGRFRRMG